MSLRIMLDSNAHDRVVARPGLHDLLEWAVADGTIDLVRTHVQISELQAIADPVKRAAALAVPGRYVPAGAMLCGVSRAGDRIGGGAGGITVQDIYHNGGGKHSRDALIAVTAAIEADVLVTEERRLQNRVRATGSRLQVWTFDQFASYVDDLVAA